MEGSVPTEVSNLRVSIDNARRSLDEFVVTLAGVYDDQKQAPEVAEFRRRIFSEATMYRRYVFPCVETLVSQVKLKFGYYTFLNYNVIQANIETNIAKLREVCAEEVRTATKVENAHNFVRKRLEIIDKDLQKKISDMKTVMDAAEPRRRLIREKFFTTAMATMFSLFDSGILLEEVHKDAYEGFRSLYVVVVKLEKLLESVSHLCTAITELRVYIFGVQMQISEVEQFDAGQGEANWQMMTLAGKGIRAACDTYLRTRFHLENAFLRLPEDVVDGFEEQWQKDYIAREEESAGHGE